jgi:DNA repair ATPase RecN
VGTIEKKYKMPTVQVQAQLSFNDLLRAVEQLNSSDLKQFVSQVIAIQAQRQAPSMSRRESIQKRYDELIAKRQAETLTSAEYQELLQMTEKIERLEVQRVEYIAELAKLRQTSLTELMDSLGISPPQYA